MRTKVKVATAEPAQAAPPPVVRSPINFGALQAPKKQTGSSYPVLPDELGTAGKLAAEIRQTREALEALEGKEKTLSAELSSLVTDNFYWQYYAGKGAVESSVEVHIPATDTQSPGKVLVMLGSRFLIPKPPGARPDLSRFRQDAVSVIGEEGYQRFFRDGFTVKVDGDKIPLDSQQEFINAINDLCVQFNCLGAVTAEPTIRATEEFKTARHTALSVEQNKKLNLIFPTVVSIKSKGVK